jgi:PKD domain-containing protein
VLVSKAGKKVTIATTGRGRRERTLVAVPRRPRSAAAAPLPTAGVARDGRILRIFVSGYELDALKEIRGGTLAAPPRPTRARASKGLDEAALIVFFLGDGPFGDKFVGVPAPPSAVNDCRELRKMIAAAEKGLDERRASGFDQQSAPFKALEQWLKDADARLVVLCSTPGTGPGPGTGPETGNPQPGNTAPTASFTFSPANNPPTAPRAGSPVSFTGTASDADGTIVSWKWEFGDNTSQTGTGAAPAASHAYANAGKYDARLTVTDNRGTTYTTASQPVKVSGPGSKTSDPWNDVNCSEGGITIDVYIPSWAQGPTFTVTNPVCPGRTQTSSGAIVAGLPPADKRYDEHGGIRKIYRVTVLFNGAPSATLGSAQATVSWN